MKTITAATLIAIVAVVTIVGSMTVVVVTGHDLTPFTIAFGSIATSTAGFLAILPVLRRQAQQLEVVKKQTNGNLTKVMAEKRESDTRLALALSLLPENAAREVLDHTMTRDEVLAFLKTNSVAVAEATSKAVAEDV